MKKIMYVCSCALLMMSCGKSIMAPAEMVAWTEDPANHLVQNKTLNGIEYSVQYLPADYLALQEQENLGKINEASFVNRRNELDDYYHFKLRMRVPGVNIDPLLYNISDQAEYSQRDMFYGYAFKEHIKLVSPDGETDTLRCQLYQFVQHHGLAPYTDMVFAFKKNEGEQNLEDLQVVFDDPVFNNGFMKYSFDAGELAVIPEVRL